jgi:isopenicillin-N epimerase
MTYLKDQFLLDPEIHFLNHGSFGACPRPVFEVYQEWQRCLERQPVEFLARRIGPLMEEARSTLAGFVGADPDEVVYFPNPTTAVNMVVRSVHLVPGDEILTTDHEYGAMDRTWRFVCGRNGAQYIHQEVPLPVSEPQAFVECFWQGVTQKTKVIFLSHITSPTALIFPIRGIIQRAKEAGILTIIDGAHAPGQIQLNLHQLGADIYTGACHKWLCAPKGAAFLFASHEVQGFLDPLVVSWGYESDRPGPSQFIDYHEWQGTRDMSAFLSVPAAIKFQQENNWPDVRMACHTEAVKLREEINALTGLEPVCPEEWFMQMFAARLPEETDLERLKTRLYEDYRVEVPMIDWNGQKLMRVSVQAYNKEEDFRALLEGLRQSPVDSKQ